MKEKKLPAGNYLEIDFNSNLLKIDEWWDIKIKQDNNYSENETIEKLLDTLNESVQRSTLSDVPLACGLSGGLDSQAIVSMLVKNNIKINTFTLGFQSFGEGDLNELKVAKTAADFLKLIIMK